MLFICYLYLYYTIKIIFFIIKSTNIILPSKYYLEQNERLLVLFRGRTHSQYINLYKIINKKETIQSINVFKIYKTGFFIFAISFLGLYIMNAPKYAIDDYLYENIGVKIKGLAKAIFILGAVASIITGLTLATDGGLLLTIGLLVIILGPIVSFVFSWVLYAFGELVDDIHNLNNDCIL